MIHNCKHCKEPFERRRKDHLYCGGSCKTMACYKRNKYEYVSGSYQKTSKETKNATDSKINKSLKAIIKGQKELKKSIENNTSQFNQIMNAALGNGLANIFKHIGKKIFHPTSLSASKSDFTLLKNDNNTLLEKVNELSNEQNKKPVVTADDYL
jgi:hypothetical protein